MKQSEIQIGKPYHNGKGRKRTVIRFENIYRDPWGYEPPDVIFTYDPPWNGLTEGRMWLPYFARWAKGEVK